MPSAHHTSPAQTPPLQGVDHVHLFVADRTQAERWYERVLGMRRVVSLEAWASDGGPLTVADAAGHVHLALFERPREPCRSTVALRVDGQAFLKWLAHLEAALGSPLPPVDHGLSWSVYFSDPDGNPFEITSYDVAAVMAEVAS
jgi:catechol-2,3-dioxygenase